MITKKQQIYFLRTILASNKKWAIQALIRMYQQQTQEEQTTGETIEANGVGFSGHDSTIMSNIANQVIKYHSISPKQMDIVFRIIPKYSKQILKMSNIEILNKHVEQHFKNNPQIDHKNKHKQLVFNFKNND